MGVGLLRLHARTLKRFVLEETPARTPQRNLAGGTPLSQATALFGRMKTR
jgi:hypothetical protein